MPTGEAHGSESACCHENSLSGSGHVRKPEVRNESPCYVPENQKKPGQPMEIGPQRLIYQVVTWELPAALSLFTTQARLGALARQVGPPEALSPGIPCACGKEL